MQSGHWAGDSAPRLRLKASSMAERFLSARPPRFQSSWFQRFDEIIALVWGIEAGYLGRTRRQMAAHDGIAAENTGAQDSDQGRTGGL